MFYDVVWWLVVRPLLALCRVKCLDAHHVPARGGVILAPNHTSYIDHFLLAGLSGRRLSFMAKSSLFDGPLRFINRLGAFPVRRGAGDDHSIHTAIAVLRRGGCLVMYCEGTMSRDGTPRERAKAGVGRLALQTRAPVVPVAILGAHEFGRRGLPRVTVRFGEPLRFEGASAPERDRQVAAAVLDEIKRLRAALAENGHRVARARGTATGAKWAWRR